MSANFVMVIKMEGSLIEGVYSSLRVNVYWNATFWYEQLFVDFPSHVSYAYALQIFYIFFENGLFFHNAPPDSSTSSIASLEALLYHS